MKKFMTIAMIILAAAMLVVSCDANKKADVDHSVLVNATLGLSESKAALVKVTSASDAEIAAIKVKIEPMWTVVPEGRGNEVAYYGNLEEGDHSKVKFTSSTDVNFNLGYISQGLWKVTVGAYANTSATDLVYNGEGTFFFTENAATHTVVLSESNNSSVKQTFTLSTIMTPAYIDGTQYSVYVVIDGDSQNPYTYTKSTATDDYIQLSTATDTFSTATDYYKPSGTTYVPATKAEVSTAFEAKNVSGFYKANTSATDWTWTYTGDLPQLSVGSHSYQVLMANTKDSTTVEVGGVAGRFYIRHGNDTAYLSGDLAKSDFVVGGVKFIVDGYDVEIQKNASTVSTLEVLTRTTDTDAEQTYTAKVTPTLGNVDVTKISWYLDGEVVAAAAGKDSYDFPYGNTTPGYHHVTAMYDKKAYYEITIKVVPSAADNGNV